MIAVPLAIPAVPGLERFPPCPAGNQSDPSPRVPPVLPSEPQTPRLPGLPRVPPLALQPLGSGVSSLLLLLSPYRIFSAGCVPKGQVAVGTRDMLVAVSSCPLWLRGMWQQGPAAARADGVQGSTGSCRRLRQLQGPACHRLGWGCCSCPAQLEGSAWKPSGMAKNCAGVLGFACLFLLGGLFIWGFCCV